MGKKHCSEVTGPGTWVSPSKRTQVVKKMGKKKFTKMKVTAKTKREQKKNYGLVGPAAEKAKKILKKTMKKNGGGKKK